MVAQFAPTATTMATARPDAFAPRPEQPPAAEVKFSMTAKLRWQDCASMALGIWIALSPWILGFRDELPLATWNALAVGAAIVVLAAADIDAPARWEAAAGLIIGGWTIASPVVLGFAAHRQATDSMFAAGVILVVLASWTLVAARRDAERQRAREALGPVNRP